MAGHLFIVRGNILRLHCDAWLLPSDCEAVVEDYWFERGLNERSWWDMPKRGWSDGNGRSRTQALACHSENRTGPRPWITDVGATDQTPFGWFVDGAVEFVRSAAASLRATGHHSGRSKPLLALPVVGTRGGGGAKQALDILEMLIPALLDEARSLDVDVALVAFSSVAYAAAQEVRLQLACSDEDHGVWNELGKASLAGEAKALARRAELGRLVVLIGAGVSVGAGVPSWNELLGELSKKAGLEENDLDSLDNLDRAQVLERLLQTQGGAADQVVRILNYYTRHSLAHSLLANLPVAEVVTTNYDTLYESACRQALDPKQLVVLGRGKRPDEAGGRWLLKIRLHRTKQPPNG